MSVAIITGSAGLVGSEAATFFALEGMDVVGIDNDMRGRFFGAEASTKWNRQRLQQSLGHRYRHAELDIRDDASIKTLLAKHGNAIELVVHAAAQPSHDWAARDPKTDFAVNALGTLNLLEGVRRHAPDAVFVFTSTNKVYGDAPNRLPLIEGPTRWEIDATHTYSGGIREDMPVDQSTHSVFGVSKLAADVMVQEYGRYFGIRTACFRGGCLTGPSHSGTQLHGFLAYLMKCAVLNIPYTVFGYEGKQVRDNIHSADLIRAFHEFFLAPRTAAVYNIGGGRYSNCSLLEAVDLCAQIVGREVDWRYSDQNRIGDHKWWIGDNSRFSDDYPTWRLQYDVAEILQEIFDANVERWLETAPV